MADLDLARFSGKMFYVWEGNHRVTAWWRHVNNFHRNDKAWHISVHCIVLDPRNKTAVLLDAMNDINWYAFQFLPRYFSLFLNFDHLILHLMFCSPRSAENNHVKSNLTSLLQHVRTFGSLELKDFKPLLTKKEYKACLESKMLKTTWYPVIMDVFISFLFRVRYLTNTLCISKSLNLLPISFLVLFVVEGDIHCGGCDGGGVSGGYTCSREECLRGLGSHVEGRAEDGKGHSCKEL